MDRLKGKTALVTAAGQGIGRASAIAMAAEGARVIATDINAKQLETLAATPGIETMRLDVLDDTEIERVVRSLPKVNVLFNCAGFVHQGTIMETSDDDWDFSFKLNVRSMFKMNSGRVAGNDGQRRRLDHQYVLSRLKREGFAESFCVRRNESRRDRHHQKCGRRLRERWHSLQRDLPRYGGNAVASRSDGRVGRRH